ncbi:MAG TPA: glycosyltransferase family 1 protein [Candidatus Acidoferrum sp.]|nr:glycosyltransferase family 1 protein [Candidatus Acidoferrum sp.]
MRIAYDGIPLIGDRFGIGHYTHHIIRAVARASLQARCVVVYPWPVNPLRPFTPDPFEEANVEVPAPDFPTRLRRRVREKLGIPAPLEALIGPVDVFHATNYLLTHPVQRAKRVVSIHDLTLILSPQWHPAGRLHDMSTGLRASAGAADRIIVPSQATKRDIVEHLRIDAERVTVVPLAVDPSFRPLPEAETRAALAPLGLSPGSYLLFLGTVEPRKNLGRLLDAVVTLGGEVGPLVLAGADGWGNDELRPRLAELERSGRLRRLGYVPASLRVPLLCGARAFVFPSLYEGFGWPPLEAMACGTPVVTSNVSALPEVVGDAALTIDPLDVEALAAAIRRLWDDEALRDTLRARGLERARRFTWEVTARLTLDVYAGVLRS